MPMMKEATDRIKILESQGLWDRVVHEWNNGKVCVSEMMDVMGQKTGVIYTFDEKPQLDALRKKFEKEHGFVVYHGIHFNTFYGEFLSLFYVSTYKNEWKDDRNDLTNGYQLVCSINIDTNEEDFSGAFFKVANGGLFLK